MGLKIPSFRYSLLGGWVLLFIPFARLAHNTALVGLQAEIALSRYSALVLGYNGEYGSGSRAQSASVKVRWAS